MTDKTLRFGPWLVAWALILVCIAWSGAQTRDDEGKSCRKEEINKLVGVIRNSRLQETDPARVVQAIQRLGEMKATEAVDELAELLAFRRWFPWERDPSQPKDEVFPISDRQRYPATLALIEMGAPSLPALIKVIEKHESDSLQSRNAMEVLIVLSRYERATYVERLKLAAAAAFSPENAERLRKAADVLEKSNR